ncbi:activated protein kinase catalytic subunit alpha-1 [Seminavis robusta]|uniref:non-specific serine/threonine protein kinase n=1 Tax=Seminavis robusta TaxID=568900 RepID=A0A9N8EI61_9STRA|nr:activated protein kinase catalytic subunit alpha-1 [Seminavis robusta]|eukprot:Sro1263_g257250.1 activated protein kinase catalytic subunit alpha-1 (1435) ;mRNA; f:19995-24299
MLNGSLDNKQRYKYHDTAQGIGLVMPCVVKSRQPTTTRCCGRYGKTLLLWTAFLVILVVKTTTAATLPGTKWLEHRLRKLARAHIIEAPSEPATLDGALPAGEHHHHPSAEHALLVVATHEGQVWTIDSTDGSLVAGFSTGPPLLVVDDQFEQATMDGAAYPAIPEGLAQSQIVPSMDGILYWRQPIDSGDTGTTSNQNSKLVPIASIRDLVDNPIQMCQEIDGGNCDILTATSLGPSLFSLNSQGSLNWARSRSTTTRVKPVPMQRKPSENGSEDTDDDDDDSESSSDSNSSTSKTNLLLQRQDYLVQQISTETGEQVWNITWGNLESLDFVGDEQGDAGAATTSSRRSRRRDHQSFHLLPSDEPVSSSSDLPSLVFGNHGKSLVALWTEPPKFLWKRDFISVITKVFGIERDNWQSVNVVAEIDDMNDGSEKQQWYSSREILQPLLGLPDREETQTEKDAFRYWWWAGGGKGMGKDKPFRDIEKFVVQPQQENGLIFVPRPPAHSLVRNSWFLNHLWDSPQARGAQSFQGFLAAEAHNDKKQTEKEKPSQPTAKPAQRKEEYQIPHLQMMEQSYDTSNMPRLLLLPPAEHPLPSPATSGGLFLSWPLVVAIITALVGTAGAAFVVYGEKKKKWMATSASPDGSGNNTSGSQGVSDLTADTLSLSATRTRSLSVTAADRSLSRSKDQSRSNLSGSDKGAAGLVPFEKAPRHTLNRSCSAPIMTSDAIVSFSGLAKTNLMSQTNHGTEMSGNIQSSNPAEKEAPPSPTDVAKGPLVKHRSAPIEMPSVVPQGIGMIDGIPLIRYSRYQAEFREIEPLGRGGFGSVFRVANVLDGREYAVKKVSIRSSDWNSPGTEAFSQELHRVLREVKFLALLDHPNVVRYYTAWLEMEENEHLPSGEESVSNANTNTLSRRLSSELLTGLDPTNEENAQSQTTSSFLGNRNSTSTSKAILSHLKPKKKANPLGWNNTFGFEDSSMSAFHPRYAMPIVPDSEDCGFIFEERSDEGEAEEEQDENFHRNHNMNSFGGHSVTSSEYSKSEHSHSVSSSWDASYSLNRRQKIAASTEGATDEEKKSAPEAADRQRRNSKTSKHTLYIQMQLCSPETLGDFLTNKEARQGHALTVSGSEAVDIPLALRLFLQIVEAVHHVHQRNLIHRDLKPSNCFIDEMGTVKVGDFGLSRESNDNDNSANSSLILDAQQDTQCAGDNTVGVGTRSYASPEQMNGSDYDAKTDIFALGMMLFELLYPMYTGMERHICFQKLRSDCTFPEGWQSSVCSTFPSLDQLVRSMLCLKPRDRPTADKVARHIQGLIEEHSVTLNISRHEHDIENLIFFRVEARPVPDVLKVVIDLIHGATAPETVEVVQYGMRSGTKKSSDEKQQKRAILEFALALSNSDASVSATRGSLLATKLEEHDDILVARHVWHQTTLANWASRSV